MAIKKVVSKIFFIMAFVIFFTIIIVEPSISSIIFISLMATAFLFLGMYTDGYFEDKIEYENIEQGKILCADLFLKAKKELITLGGECNSDFYQKHDPMRNALKEISKNDIHTRFLFGPNFDIDSFDILKLSKEGKIKMKRLKRRYLGEHFKIADNEFVFAHMSHKPLDLDRSGYVTHSQTNAMKKRILFEDLWEKSEDFDVETAVLTASEIQEKYLDSNWLENSDGEWGKTSGFIKRIFIIKDGKQTSKVVPASMEDINELKKKLSMR